MMRHTPTLFTHTENDSDDDETWDAVANQPYSANPLPPGSKSRIKLRSRNSYTAISTAPALPSAPSSSAVPKYSDLYSQFVQRYRSGPDHADPRTDPDSHFYQRDYGQIPDGADSDDEDALHGSVGPGGEVLDRFSALMLDAEPIEPQTIEQRERLEWQTMLASVLGGDVLKSEKTRIAGAMESSAEEQNNRHVNIWLGLRARLHGRSVEEERKWLDERRLRLVDAAINEISTFRVSTDDVNPVDALKQVKAALSRFDAATSLYPNLKLFHADKPAALQSMFQARCDTLYTWSTVLTSLRKQIALLRKWTGSESLDVTQPNTDPELPIGAYSRSRTNGGPEMADGTTFVDRVLKEDSSQRTFEKGFLTTVHTLIGTARDAQVNLAPYFAEMNLPTFEKELVPLISFPTKLVQAILRVRLDYAKKLKDPEVLIIEQMIEDLKINIGLACTLKRQYEAFLAPDPDGNWSLPSCISEDYDDVVLDALQFFFKLTHWKLKSGAKSIYFKETDVLDGQWATYNDVSLSTSRGSCVVAEQLCSLTNKLLVRVTNYFESQIRIPSMDSMQGTTGANGAHAMFADSLGIRRKMNDQQVISWYSKILESGRLRHRRLHRFARSIAQRFNNCADYSLEGTPMDLLVAALVETDHFLVYTQTFEEDGTYIIAPHMLRDRPEEIRRILTEAFRVHEVFSDDGTRLANSGEPGAVDSDIDEEIPYVLVLSPRTQFLWNGLVLMLEIPKIDLDIDDNRVRLIADGAQARLALAKEQFAEVFLPIDEEGEPIESALEPLTCVVEQRAHLPTVNRELRKISRATTRLAESTVDSVHHVRKALRGTEGHQEQLELWYAFASEHGQHTQRYMDRGSLLKFNRLLIKLAISWVSFICDDCDPNDRRTFRWAVSALEFALHRTRRNNILHLPDDQFEMLRQKVASCMTLLISHFDILGARSIKEKERHEELLRQATLSARAAVDDEDEDDGARCNSPNAEEAIFFADSRLRMFWDKTTRAIIELEESRAQVGSEHHMVGRVLEDKPENRSLIFLASSSSNIAIRWQQGRFIGAGAFGSVYLAVNLDSGSLMAVKEIKFQELSGMPNLYSQIKDELSVMEMLHHPNVVEYYGIEVHRDKVYIFEEYCQGGSLAQLLEHGRIEDEGIIQVYTLQMLEGLAYLHSRGIVHRDIKPDNILLDHMGVIKYVDFGAAKVLAKNQRTMQRTRRSVEPSINPAAGVGTALGGGLGVNNSLTGTPMYMSPEVIKNDKRGRHGAMDIWSLGCVVLEFATGRKPWSNLDNEWAIMFHIGVATQHPPLPDPSQLSDSGINFIKQCLTIDPMKRPSATELMDHPWMLEFREALRSYEEQELENPPAEMPAEEEFESASVARQAAIIQEKALEDMQSESPELSAIDSPSLSLPATPLDGSPA